jgi:molecular chaperone GrpE
LEEKMNEGIPGRDEDEEIENLTAEDVELVGDEEAGEESAPAEGVSEKGEGELAELNDKYLRLYAEFENYKKRVARDKEGLVKYANESLLYDMLPSLDNLEIALQHAEGGDSGLVEGVKNTLRELYRNLEKFGLTHIEAEGRAFDPEYHHAMSQVERDDVEEKTVVEEFRKGFMYRDKVLRASLVSVSRRPSISEGGGGESEQE